MGHRVATWSGGWWTRVALEDAYCIEGSLRGPWCVAQSPGLHGKLVVMSGESQRGCKRAHGPGGPTRQGGRWHQDI
jgi:hypothetical protein